MVPEACYLLNTYLGQTAENGFISSLKEKELSIEHFTAHDLARSLEIMMQYNDLNLGFTDASIVAIAERLKTRKILTTDTRHFSVVRPKHCSSFILLP